MSDQRLTKGTLQGQTCTNCGKLLTQADDVHMFQAVVCCQICHKIVQTKLERADTLLRNVLTIYRDTLRQALIKRQANLPTLPKEDTMPMPDLAAAMNILRTVNAHGTKEPQDS